MMLRMVVVLPAPFRPMSTVTAARRAVRVTPWRIWCCPINVWRPSTSSTVSLISAKTAAEIGRLHVRVATDGYRGVIGDEAPGLERGDRVRESHDHVDLVLHEEDRAVSATPDGLDERDDGRHFLQAHTCGGLVEQQHVGVQGKEDAHLELPLLAVGELAGRRLRFGPEEDGVEDLPRPILQLGKAPVALPRVEGEARACL